MAIMTLLVRRSWYRSGTADLAKSTLRRRLFGTPYGRSKRAACGVFAATAQLARQAAE
jgi:hypothetical protein